MAKRKTRKGSKKAKAKPASTIQVKEKRNVRNNSAIIEYTFIALLGGYILLDILPNSGIIGLPGLSPYLDMIWLGLIGITSVWLIWMNRQKLSEQSPTIPPDKTALNASNSKLAKIPLLGRIVGYFYGQGKWVNLGLLILIIVAGIIYFYNLSYYNWLPDEPLVMRTARGYLESGTFYKWDYWTNTLTDEAYARAWPHTWLVAQSINLFGSTEFTARMVSSFFGLLTIPILYFVSNFILRNKLAALLITACLVFHPYTVHYFRRVRMYAVLIPIFILLFYYCYQSITARKSYTRAFYNKWPAVKDYLNFNWAYILLALVLLYLNYEIHKISLVILPAFLVFYLYLLISKRDKRLLLILVIALIPAIYLILKENVWQMFINEVGNNWVYNPLYWQFLFKYPVTIGLSLVMILLSIVWSVFSKQRDPLIAAISLVVAGVVLYIYVIDFNDHYRYVIHLIPFCLILSLGMMIKLSTLVSNKYIRVIIPALIVFSAISEYSKEFEGVYYNNIEAQFPKQAYPTIVQNIKPESEAVFGLIFQDYYMAGLGDRLQLVEMAKDRMFTLEQYYRELRKYRAAWITWPTRKSNHVNQEFYQHIASKCVKYHGYGVDNTLTEVFYCPK